MADVKALHELLHDRRFVARDNPHGISGADTVFHYRVVGATITATYQGGRVAIGHVIGRATGPETIETLYHCQTVDGSLMAGWSRGRVGTDNKGCTILDFDWAWVAGAQGGGQSSYVELSKGDPNTPAT